MLDRTARQNLPSGHQATSLGNEKPGRWSATMRLDDTEQSENIEDRRGEPGGGFGGGFGLPLGGGGLGIGTIVVLGLIGWALGIDPRILIGGAEIFSGGGPHVQQPIQPPRGHARRTSKPRDDTGGLVSTIIRHLATESTYN